MSDEYKKASRAAFERQLAVLLVIVPLVSGCLARSANDTDNESAAVTRSDVRHISVAIDRSPRDVYDFASRPENLPRWARGLAESIEHVDGEWIARSPMGAVKVRFAPRNGFGVLDHDVTLESGVSVHNPMRVVARDRGHSEVVFTLFRRPGITDAAFEADAGAVQRDLRSLEDVLERATPSAPH